MNPLNITMTRRAALGLGVATTAGLTLAACAGGGTGAKSGSGSLKFWSNHPGESMDIEKEIIEKWNADNPDWQVELVTGGSNYEELAQKFNAALSGGELPDIIVASDVTWFNFAINDQTTNLDEYWDKAEVNKDDYVDTLIEDYNYEDKHFGVPYARSTCLMYWNTDKLKEAGLPTDRGPKDWDEFVEWAEAIKKKNPDSPVLVVPDGSNYLDWYFQCIIWALGGSYSEGWDPTFTSAESIKAGQFLQDQVKAGHIEISTDPTVAFGNGNSASLLESTGSLGGLTETATIPFITTYLPGPGPSAATGGAGVAIPAGIDEERKVAALKFIGFLTNTDNAIKFSQATGYMPVRKDAVDNPEEKAFLKENPNAETAIKQLAENTQPQDNARVFIPGGGERIGGGLDRITLNKEDVETVFKQLQDETQDAYDKQIKPKLEG